MFPSTDKAVMWEHCSYIIMKVLHSTPIKTSKEKYQIFWQLKSILPNDFHTSPDSLPYL